MTFTGLRLSNSSQLCPVAAKLLVNNSCLQFLSCVVATVVKACEVGDQFVRCVILVALWAVVVTTGAITLGQLKARL